MTITSAEQAAVVQAGSNNVIDGTSPLSGVQPQGGALTLTPFDASQLNGTNVRLVKTSFVGAVDPANPTDFDQWAGCGGKGQPDFPSSFPPTSAPVCPPGTRASKGLAEPASSCILQNMTTDTHLTAGIQYYLVPSAPTVLVGSDIGADGKASGGHAVMLIIDAGVTIGGFIPSSIPSALIAVSRGSRIVVNGTRTNPVSFSNVGLLIAGRAPISNCRAGTSANDQSCEQVYTRTSYNSTQWTDTVTSYGGPVEADNSGAISFLRVTVNVLTNEDRASVSLLGVGSATSIDHLLIDNSPSVGLGKPVGNGPLDGLAIVGGTANASFVSIPETSDDSLTIEGGWQGALQFLLIQQDSASAPLGVPELLEVNAITPDDSLPRTRGTIANYTFVQATSQHEAAIIGNGADFTLANGIIKTPSPCLSLAASTDANGGKSTIRPAGGTGAVPTTIDEQGPPHFFSNYFACLGR